MKQAVRAFLEARKHERLPDEGTNDAKKLAKKMTPGETAEEVQFKVDIDGLPPTFMTGRSSAEILGKLRKIVKQPSMIKDVERYTAADVKKAYRKKAQGKVMESSNDTPANPDEAEMAKTQLEFICYAAEEIQEHIESGKRFPEWMQNKLSQAHEKMKGLHASLGDHNDKSMDEATVKLKAKDLDSYVMDLVRNASDAEILKIAKVLGKKITKQGSTIIIEGNVFTINEGSESWEDGYKRRVVKTTKPEHKEKGYKWRIKGKDKSHLTIKLYKEKPSQEEFNKQMKRVAGHEFGG